jgi:hypothetical protein
VGKTNGLWELLVLMDFVVVGITLAQELAPQNPLTPGKLNATIA